MPLDLTCDTDETIDLQTYVERLDRVDVDDEAALLSSARDLRALYNNRTFLLETLIGQLAERQARERGGYVPEYTPNVFMLATRRRFAVRAIVWPAAGAEQTQEEKAVFSFELPHDHNFDFMTIGYYGPGYDTDLAEYDIARVVGYPGEPVALARQGVQRLSPGRIWYFRRGVDVHTQLPPASLSISLNLLLHRPGDLGPQYTFELDRGAIVDNIHRDPQGALFDMLAPLVDDGLAPAIEGLAAGLPNPQARLAAYRALARHRGAAAWRAAAGDASELIRRHAAIALDGAAAREPRP